MVMNFHEKDKHYLKHQIDSALKIPSQFILDYTAEKA
jgi:hypothetical protein